MTKKINGFEDLYSITTEGVVTNIRTNKVKVNTLGKNGYYTSTLFKEGKSYTMTIHRLLALNFIDNPENKRTVNHIDGVKTNNSLDNLEWSTDSENIQHAYDNGLMRASGKKVTTKHLIEVYERLKSGEFLTNIVKDYEFNLSTLSTHLTKYVLNNDLCDEYNSIKKEHKLVYSKSAGGDRTQVNMLDTNKNLIKSFKSLKDAARYLGKKSSGPISNVLSGRHNKAYGYYWELA